MQYLHPFEAESYREAVRALRMIGRDAILRRVAALEKLETVPSDILSCILKVSSKAQTYICIKHTALLLSFGSIYYYMYFSHKNLTANWSLCSTEGEGRH